jgi:DNA-binding NarL/FixJ family response regulator
MKSWDILLMAQIFIREILQTKLIYWYWILLICQRDGIEVIKECSGKALPCKIIILSSYDDKKIIEEVMKWDKWLFNKAMCW